MLPPRIRQIFQRCADDFDISVIAMINGGHGRRVVMAKRKAARELRAKGYTLAEIGRFLHCHHSSVMHLINPGPGETLSEVYASTQIPCADLSGEWAI